MKNILWLFLLSIPAIGQNPSPVPWFSATPPTSCPGPLPVYIIANGYTGAGTLYGNTSASTGTSCSALNNPSGGTGTVTSVTFTGDGTVLSSTPSSAVTTSGTLTAVLAAAAQNSLLGGPPSGGAGAPSYQTAPTFSIANAIGMTASQVTTAQGYVSLAPTTPAWLQYLGTGSDGAETCNGNLQGDFNYTTFNVPLGDTCSSNFPGGLIVHATGACTINGTMVAPPSVGSAAQVLFIAASGGAGGGTAAGGAGGAYAVNAARSSTGGGTAGAASGGNGGNAGALSNNYAHSMLDSAMWGWGGWYVIGSPGAQGGSTGGAGGLVSGSIVLICGSITGTGSITTAGGAGGNSPGNNQGAGSGAGGGLLILSSQTTETFSGLTLSVAAGAPGSCLSFTGCGTPGTSQPGIQALFSGW